MIWPPERKAYVRALRAEGLSLSQIARELNVPRNAISGVFHRMGLNRKRRPAEPKKPRARTGPRPGTATGGCTAPFEGDNSCPDFAWDEPHCDAINALGGYPVLPRRVA